MFPLPCHSLAVLSASGFQFALDQPFFPGKIILWLLFMLSLMSWAVMASKIVSLRRFRQGDSLFTRRLRESKRPLEIHEKGWSEPMSLRQEVYTHGAKEAAFQLLGTIRRTRTKSLPASESLTESQVMSLREALERGEQSARSRLQIGMPVLQAAAAGGPFLGLLGMVWILMNSFSAGANTNQISAGLSGGLAVMAIALLAATPAIFGQIVFRSAFRSKLRELGDFRVELTRLFERSLAAAWGDLPESDVEMKTFGTKQEVPTEAETASEPEKEDDSSWMIFDEDSIDEPQPIAAAEEAAQSAEKPVKKVYHTVRKRPSGEDEPMINPIALQAKSARAGT
ncbi:MAG: MotA/TolQ/ExbB proton channel family protein [Verrucomicrobiales bacterium]|nr:MotA/TolQ/ExbB proton channel family protein [Verrucomicrobiales bacterium]